MSSRLVVMVAEECPIDWTPSGGRSTMNRPFLRRHCECGCERSEREECAVIIVPRLVPVADPN